MQSDPPDDNEQSTSAPTEVELNQEHAEECVDNEYEKNEIGLADSFVHPPSKHQRNDINGDERNKRNLDDSLSYKEDTSPSGWKLSHLGFHS